ncbi:MAG TPA: hypothetical protein VK925_05915 [Jiangellaceae bacterium]|nr:hypothetical protein [Jiangellaceae bacterium]
MANRRVALATCEQFPWLDEDDRLVIPELATWGVRAEPVVWTDESVDWDAFDLTVIRSTWDYVDRLDDFLAWAACVPRLANAAEAVRWNTDKSYLRDLARAGVPVVPTNWFEPGDEVHLPYWGLHVVKPAVGAGSRDAGRFDLADPDERELARKHAQRLLDRGATVLSQPYLEAVDTVGETAMLFMGGSFSHAVRKAPLLSGPDTDVEGLFRAERISPRMPSPGERAVAETVLAALPARLPAPLYARVDLLPDADGRPVLLELELTEPSLFLAHGEQAAARLAAAVGTHLDRVLKTG